MSFGCITLPRPRGHLIDIEGIDQSGKETQAKMLAAKLTQTGIAASVMNFPDYSTPLGRQLKAYLVRKTKLEPHVVHMLYAANRWERKRDIEGQIQSGRFVILNRYSPSNLAYGIAHGLRLKWLNVLEEGLPTPDIVIVLDISPKLSFARKKSRRDLHESDLEYLRRVRRAYLTLAAKHSWKVVRGNRDPRHVNSDIWQQVTQALRVR